MKIFIICVLVSLVISAGLTFLIFADREEKTDPLRQQYAKVLSEFGKNAEDVYNQYGADGLDILENHRIKGLCVLKQYEHLIEILRPSMDMDTLFDFCYRHGAQLEELLQQFQPAIIAEVYTQFGSDGLQYILDEPQRYFLLRQYGEPLVQLANTKGPIVFDVVKKHPPEFIELYYDDALFKTINRFGAEGLIAVKHYRGMATTMFDLFAADERFDNVLQKYGYRQVIPLLYYFYHKKPETSALAEFNVHELFQQAPEEMPEPSLPDQITMQHEQSDRARWALSRIYEQGNTFLRQFDISETGDVTPLQIVSMANLLEDLLIIGSPGRDFKVTPNGKTASCAQLIFALDMLGILPYETLFSQLEKCVYLRAALPSVTTREGVQGVFTLEEHQDLVVRYGDEAVPFISRYGREGVQLLEQTDGKILQLVSLYGQDLTHVTLKYGPEVLDLINEFGKQMVDAIQKTDGEVIPYARKYGKDIFTVLAQPDGDDILLLCPIFGEEIVQYVIRYPEESIRYLLQYGQLAVTALQNHGNTAISFARKYGDEMIYYAGVYGDAAFSIGKAGTIGIVLLRVLPEALWKKRGKRLFRFGLPGVWWSLFINHPRKFHEYIGLLGEELLSVAPHYFQLVFWTITVLLILLLLRLGYKVVTSILRRQSLYPK